MIATFVSLSVVPWILVAQSSWTMDAVTVITATQPQETASAVGLRDRGTVFGHEAGRGASDVLRQAQSRHRTPVLVETVRSLDGVGIAEAAQRRAKMAGVDRLYILVAGDERNVGVIGARNGPASRLTDQQRDSIRRSFLGPLQAGKPDEAIDRGVRAIVASLDATAEARPGVRDALIAAASVSTALAALFASQVLARNWFGSEQRRRTSRCGRVDRRCSAVP